VAAFAARCLARVATAFAVGPTHKAVAGAFAADTTWSHTDVATTRAARTALERIAVRVDAFDRVPSARRALRHRVFVAWLPLVAALAAGSSASIAAALAACLAREGVAKVISAAEIALGLAHIPTALAVAAAKFNAVLVPAHRHTPTCKPLGHVHESLRGSECHERALFIHALTIQALLDGSLR